MTKRKRAAHWRRWISVIALLFLGGFDLKAVFEAQGAVDSLRRASRLARIRPPSRIWIRAIARGQIPSLLALESPPGENARFTREIDREGADQIRVDLPEGQVPLRYVFFGQTRQGECLHHWNAPAEGWTRVERVEEPEKRYKDRHAFFRTRISIPAAQISESSIDGDDLLLLGVTVEAQSQYSDLASMIAYTYVLKSPARGTRRWNALFIHRCSEQTTIQPLRP